MNSLKLIHERLAEAASTLDATRIECSLSISNAAKTIASRVKDGGQIFLCGNGGSASDASHIAAEFTSRLRKNFERPGIQATNLAADLAYITARSNDFSYSNVFEHLIKTFGWFGDVLIGISTSGSSENVLRAMAAARTLGILTVGLTGGEKGGDLEKQSDICIRVPSTSTQHIQEAHLTIGHILVELIEEALYGIERE